MNFDELVDKDKGIEDIKAPRTEAGIRRQVFGQVSKRDHDSQNSNRNVKQSFRTDRLR